MLSQLLSAELWARISLALPLPGWLAGQLILPHLPEPPVTTGSQAHALLFLVFDFSFG